MTTSMIVKIPTAGQAAETVGFIIAFAHDERAMADEDQSATLIEEALSELDGSTLDSIFTMLNEGFEEQAGSPSRLALVRRLVQASYWDM